MDVDDAVEAADFEYLADGAGQFAEGEFGVAPLEGAGGLEDDAEARRADVGEIGHIQDDDGVAGLDGGFQFLVELLGVGAVDAFYRLDDQGAVVPLGLSGHSVVL